MKGGAKYQLLIISIVLVLSLVLQTLPTSNAQVTSGAQAKRVMFRDDDVTPGSLNVLEAVNQVHIDEGVPVTLGVIPAQSFQVNAQSHCAQKVPSKDPSATFVIYMQSLTSSGLFEFAQHGYAHCSNSKLYGIPVASEFRGMPYDEQYRLIEEGRSVMQAAFGAAPTTFIPPYNAGDENTITAVSELGFTVYSSYKGEFTLTSGGGLTLEPQLLIIGENETFESLARQTEPLLSDPHVNDIVVAYHNWKFAENHPADGVNTTKVLVLREYIQYLKTKNVTFTTLSGTHPSPQVTVSPSSITSASTLVSPAQRAGDPWVWALLGFAAPLLVTTLLFGLMKRVK